MIDKFQPWLPRPSFQTTMFNSLTHQTLLIMLVHLIGVWGQNVTDCTKYQRERPDIFSVQGTGSVDLPTTIGTIIFKISTLDLNAAVALKAANVQLNTAIRYQSTLYFTSAIQTTSNSIKFTTTGLSVAQEYKWVNDPLTNQSVSVFQGYRVQHTLTIRTTDLTIMGAIIDQGIYNGLKDVDSIQFQLDPSDQKKQKEQLIEFAVNDAKARAKLALDPLGLEIIAIKSVDINEYIPYQYQYESSMARSFSFAAAVPPTQVFASTKNVNIHVTVGFGIRIKKSLLRSKQSAAGRVKESIQAIQKKLKAADTTVKSAP